MLLADTIPLMVMYQEKHEEHVQLLTFVTLVLFNFPNMVTTASSSGGGSSGALSSSTTSSSSFSGSGGHFFPNLDTCFVCLTTSTGDSTFCCFWSHKERTGFKAVFDFDSLLGGGGLAFYLHFIFHMQLLFVTVSFAADCLGDGLELTLF